MNRVPVRAHLALHSGPTARVAFGVFVDQAKVRYHPVGGFAVVVVNLQLVRPRHQRGVPAGGAALTVEGN